jgi:hypothetical protein
MSFKISHFILTCVLILAFTVSGCRKELDLANWDVDLLAPLAEGTINVSNYAPENLISIGTGDLIHLILDEELLSIGLDTLIGIPDYSVDTSFFVPFDYPVDWPPGLPFLEQTSNTKFDLKGARLTYAIIRESSISVELNNTINKPVLFIYEISSASLNGDTFRIEERIEAKTKFKKDYDLNGYELDLRGPSQKEYNTIYTKAIAMIHPDEATGYKFRANEKFDVVSTITNVIPEYVLGYFGNQTAIYAESQSLDVFDQIPFTSANITDFELKMIIDNGIGADLKLVIDQLGSENTVTEANATLQHSIIGSPQLFTRAINLFDPENPAKHISKTFTFTDENSNLDQLLELRPNNFTADLNLEVNPLGNISRGNDFVYYGHDLTATMRADIPLIVSAKGLQLSDTFDFNYRPDEKNNPLDRLNYGTMRFILSNGYPIEAGVQFYLMDSIGNQLDSLLLERTWIAGAVEEQSGLVEKPAKSVLEVPIDQELFMTMELANRMRVNAILNTVGLDSVHIRANQKLDFKVVADINANTKK